MKRGATLIALALLFGCREADPSHAPLQTPSPAPASNSDARTPPVDHAGSPPAPAYNPDGTLAAETLREISGRISKRSAGEYVTSVRGEQIRGDLKSGIDALARMPRLRTLSVDDMSEEGLTKSDYQAIARLDRLDMIWIEGREPIDAAALEPLAGMPKLKTLEFEEAQVTPAAVAPLAKSLSLEELRIGTGWGIREEAERLGVRFRVVHTQNYEP